MTTLNEDIFKITLKPFPNGILQAVWAHISEAQSITFSPSILRYSWTQLSIKSLEFKLQQFKVISM